MPHVHNALHHFTRVQAAYRAALGEADSGFTGIERAGETITPVIDLWRRAEWALLLGEVVFSRFATVGPFAADRATHEFVNPAGSNVLAVVYQILNQSGVGLEVEVDSGPATGAVATLRGLACDTRFSQLGDVSRCTIVTGQQAAGVAIGQARLSADFGLEVPFIVAPGRRVFLSGTIDNVPCAASWYWSERLATDEELAAFGR